MSVFFIQSLLVKIYKIDSDVSQLSKVRTWALVAIMLYMGRLELPSAFVFLLDLSWRHIDAMLECGIFAWKMPPLDKYATLLKPSRIERGPHSR